MVNTEPIKISFQYTQDDFLEACRHYRVSNALAVKYGKPLAVLFLFLGMGSVLVVGWNWFVLLLFLIAIEAWFDLIGELRCWSFYRANQQSIAERYDAIIDESGIYIKSLTLEAKRSWGGYQGIIETDQAFLLIQGRGAFSIYPKRAFRDDDQMSDFRILLSEKIETHEQAETG